jgi:hypothetical protein
LRSPILIHANTITSISLSSVNSSKEKIDKTSQIPKEKEEEEEEPVITFSTYKFTFYVKPKNGGKTYQSVKKLPDLTMHQSSFMPSRTRD